MAVQAAGSVRAAGVVGGWAQRIGDLSKMRWPGWLCGRPREGAVRRRHRGPPGPELVGDCEAFLAGHVAERIEERAAGDVPVWAWTNLLAHGTDHDLRTECTALRARSVPTADKWREARSYLAAEVIDLANDCGPLAKVQRAVLVPLELELACEDVAGWGPRQWVTSVEVALSQHRRVSRRRVARDAPPPR